MTNILHKFDTETEKPHIHIVLDERSSKKSKFSRNQNLITIFETNDDGNTKMRPGSTIINKLEF